MPLPIWIALNNRSTQGTYSPPMFPNESIPRWLALRAAYHLDRTGSADLGPLIDLIQIDTGFRITDGMMNAIFMDMFSLSAGGYRILRGLADVEMSPPPVARTALPAQAQSGVQAAGSLQRTSSIPNMVPSGESNHASTQQNPTRVTIDLTLDDDDRDEGPMAKATTPTTSAPVPTVPVPIPTPTLGSTVARPVPTNARAPIRASTSSLPHPARSRPARGSRPLALASSMTDTQLTNILGIQDAAAARRNARESIEAVFGSQGSNARQASPAAMAPTQGRTSRDLQDPSRRRPAPKEIPDNDPQLAELRKRMEDGKRRQAERAAQTAQAEEAVPSVEKAPIVLSSDNEGDANDDSGDDDTFPGPDPEPNTAFASRSLPSLLVGPTPSVADGTLPAINPRFFQPVRTHPLDPASRHEASTLVRSGNPVLQNLNVTERITEGVFEEDDNVDSPDHADDDGDMETSGVTAVDNHVENGTHPRSQTR